MPAHARMAGRLIVIRPPGMTEDLCLFTTLKEPDNQVVAAYGERWNIETDLRSIKEQVRLHTIAAQSPKMIACEVLMAITSYNLIRTVMAEAARHVGVEPRTLSFSRSRNAFWAFVRAIAHTESTVRFDQQWSIMIRILGQAKLYKRQRPSYPRAIWHNSPKFPHHQK
jgi:hypothetical protein